ncbi:MAG: aminotransferase class V-fold PLP-dependent enzyme, partial [Alphaproteobacteria bacterium]
NETSTGATSRVAAVRQAIDAAGHDALFLVDTISGLASMDYRHDEWGVDVTVAGSQKGLMTPPGLGFNAVGPKALAAAEKGGVRRSYWDWGPMLALNATGYFPYTPATNLLYGLREAVDMLLEEGLPQVFRRHHRLAEGARRAVQAWGLDILCQTPEERSNVLTAVMLPGGHDADALRAKILERFDVSLGNGLGKVKGRVFRIGHLGEFNEPMLLVTLSAVEMGLKLADVPHQD